MALRAKQMFPRRRLKPFVYCRARFCFWGRGASLSSGWKGRAPGGEATRARASQAWPKLLMLLRLLGAPGHLISRVSTEHGVTPLSRLKYESFLEIVFPIVVQLDQGADVGEITVINEVDRHGHVRSKMCTIL